MDYKDVSLLGALDILLNEGSVVGAAEKLHLSSSAVRRILARIRAVTGDDILVPAGRTTRGLCPDSGKTDSESVVLPQSATFEDKRPAVDSSPTGSKLSASR